MKVNFVVTPILFLIFSSGCLNSSRKSLSLTLQAATSVPNSIAPVPFSAPQLAKAVLG